METVLFVDDEESVLRSIERIFADEDLRLLTAKDGEQALDIVKNVKVCVLMSDNMMPGMKGMELLRLVRFLSPDTVKIMLTAFTDLATVLEAVNMCDVFRFVVKPWENSSLINTVHDALVRYRFIESLRREDEAILCSLAQTIELKDPYTKGHCERVSKYALIIASVLNLPEIMQKEIRFGSWLHDCGKIGVPEAILNHTGNLGEKDFEVVKRHPGWGAEVALKAGFGQTVVNIIRYHHECFDGNGYPQGLAGYHIPLEARIVAVADVYDALTSKRPYHDKISSEESREILLACRGKSLDPELIDIFLLHLKGEGDVND